MLFSVMSWTGDMCLNVDSQEGGRGRESGLEWFRRERHPVGWLSDFPGGESLHVATK